MKHNLIAGEWVPGDIVIENISPADPSDIVGHYASAGAEQTRRAITAARQAFPGWSMTSPQLRADLLDRIGTSVLKRKEEIGRLLAREEGKTLPEAVAEAARAGQIFRFFAGEALRIEGDAVASVRPEVDVSVTREPLGVIGIITPWNFPIAIPAWKIAPALAYGNAVVFKPAELTPACAHVLAEIIDQAGVPAGVFNLVMGPGTVVGQGIAESAEVDAISFTGSVQVGQRLAAEATRTMTKLQLEMGGKNPLVVLNDADLKVAVPAAINGAFYSTGQRCTASSRLIVEAGIHDAFVEQLIEHVAAQIVGDPLEARTQIGPVVSRGQLQSNLDYVALAKDEGAKVVGGEQIENEKGGFLQRPALFLGATNDMRTSQEEIFGPCASVIKADDFDHALYLANDSPLGLSAGICTSSLKSARRFQRQAQAGMVMVNLPTAGVDYHVPFGGRKGSSYGAREQGRYAAEFFTTVKTAYCFAG